MKEKNPTPKPTGCVDGFLTRDWQMQDLVEPLLWRGAGDMSDADIYSFFYAATPLMNVST